MPVTFQLDAPVEFVGEFAALPAEFTPSEDDQIETNYGGLLYDFEVSEQVPEDFIEALNDVRLGRLVELDIALDEPPPGV